MQVLDYTQLENEMSITGNKIALSHEPLSVRDVLDEVADIISARVNVRKVLCEA